MKTLSPDDYQSLLQLALDEDIGAGDLTAQLLPEDCLVTAKLITRESMVLCGREVFDTVFRAIDPQTQMHWHYEEADWIAEEGCVCTLYGQARALTTGERIAMNFLQTLSGTATTTRKTLEAMGSAQAVLLDTRKTLPGWRRLQKYAVRCGGAKNHRSGLYDAYLIKENHISACGSITEAIAKARAAHPEVVVEVEVENFEQLGEAIDAKADWVMLDNFSLDDCRRAAEYASGRVKLEVSGNLQHQTIRSWAQTGVDALSVGALTKHLRAIDLSMRIVNK